MLVGYISHYVFGITIFLTSMFLIMLVLVQRGRGGGIAGALGGAGGQSAFGTKAGDLFTRITVGVATFWILLCCVAILFLRERTFSTGVDKQQAKSGAISGAATGPTNGDASADGSAPPQSDSGSAAPATTPPEESASAASETATTAPVEGEPPQGSDSTTSNTEPEVSELGNETPVSAPE